MACNDFKTAEAKGKSWLRTLGAIDKYLNITNLNKFRTNVTELSNYAKDKYGISERLFLEEDKGRKAVPNMNAFHKIDAINEVWYEDNLYLKKETVPLQIKEGVDFVFEQTPELNEIGDMEQYSIYLNSIFPDSKVKDILIYSSKFNLIKDETKALNSLFNTYRSFGGFIVSPSNLGHPFGTASAYKDYRVLINPKSEQLDKGTNGTGNEGYKITKNKEFYTLGTQKDIEGFRNFVNNKTTNSLSDNNSYISSTEKESYAKRIEDFNSQSNEIKLSLEQIPNQDVYYIKKTYTSRYLKGEETQTTLPLELLPDHSQVKTCYL